MRPIMVVAMMSRRTAIFALIAAGALWGLTVPLTKLSLEWLGGGWLTVARFALAAPLLAWVGRRGLRDAFTPAVLGAGAFGFGLVILLQNAGVARTSVSHAALVVGAVPVIVALLSAVLGHGLARPVAWAGYAIALAGLAMVAGAGGSGASATGDLLVLGSVMLSATFIVVQPRLLAGRDPAAVTAVQFLAGALVALPHAVVLEGVPAAPVDAAPVVALIALSLAGTLLPFWLFAYGQARVPAGLAGSFLNLEPLVGAGVGWVAFGETAAAGQVAGAVFVLAGIALSTMPARPAPVPVRRAAAVVRRRSTRRRGDHHAAHPARITTRA
jgi:O-acetylserine/cysteine efflux transporter